MYYGTGRDGAGRGVAGRIQGSHFAASQNQLTVYGGRGEYGAVGFFPTARDDFMHSPMDDQGRTTSFAVLFAVLRAVGDMWDTRIKRRMFPATSPERTPCWAGYSSHFCCLPSPRP